MSKLNKAPLPPHNAEAEDAVLGSVLIDPEALMRVTPILQPEDFYRQKNGWIFEAVLALERRREPVDFVTLGDELERQERLNEIGGVAHLGELVNTVPSALHVESYARLVHEDAVRRRILKAASLAARLAYDRDHPLDDALSQIETTFLHLRGQIAFEDRLRPFSEIMQEVYDDLEAARQGDTPNGSFTGFPDLDQMLGGLRPGNLVLVGARPSRGKTSLLTSLAARAIWDGTSSVLFSLEMSSNEVAQRMLTMETGIDVLRLQTGQVRDGEWPILMKEMGVLSEMPLWVDDTPQISVGDLRAKVRRLYAEQGLGMVLLDYVQLAHPMQRYKSRYREIGEITAELKGMAKELGIIVVAASQLSRAVEQRMDTRPRLSDLRESGNQESDADVVILIHHDGAEMSSYHEAELVVAKNRHGETGSVPVVWQPQRVRFISTTPLGR